MNEQVWKELRHFQDWDHYPVLQGVNLPGIYNGSCNPPSTVMSVEENPLGYIPEQDFSWTAGNSSALSVCVSLITSLIFISP